MAAPVPAHPCTGDTDDEYFSRGSGGDRGSDDDDAYFAHDGAGARDGIAFQLAVINQLFDELSLVLELIDWALADDPPPAASSDATESSESSGSSYSSAKSTEWPETESWESE